MSEITTIAWTDATFNGWEGCTPVSPGCDHCYAKARNRRFGGGIAVNWGAGAPRRRTSNATWRAPHRWNKAHAKFVAEHGRRRRVFCSSLADVFDNEVPAQWRRDLADLILATPNIDWQVLTKRIGNAQSMLADMFPMGMPENVWIGATVVSQAEADRDIPKLLKIRASVRFLSIEPMLGAIDLRRYLPWAVEIGARLPEFDRINVGIDWVIAGGESGSQARPMHPSWVRELRDQCQASGVPFFFKQWGEYRPAEPAERASVAAFSLYLDGRQVRVGSAQIGEDAATLLRLGTRRTGNTLDGVQHHAFPSRRTAASMRQSGHVFVSGAVGASTPACSSTLLSSL